MASFGAKNPYFCKVKEEPEGALPTYEGEPVKIGRLVKADLTLQMASGKLHADDELAESVEGAESLTYDKMLITMTVSNLNNATDFTVPEEAKNA